jgi:molecular chaperone GrpE (heat shock protein)
MITVSTLSLNKDGRQIADVKLPDGRVYTYAVKNEQPQHLVETGVPIFVEYDRDDDSCIVLKEDEVEIVRKASVLTQEEIDELADEFDQIIAGWVWKDSGDDMDEEMQESHKMDREDMATANEFFREGHFDLAYTVMDNFDTIIRDMVPQKMWQFLVDRAK